MLHKSEAIYVEWYTSTCVYIVIFLVPDIRAQPCGGQWVMVLTVGNTLSKCHAR